MKGLLLKDFYITRSILAILGIVFIIIGASLSYLVSPWTLTVLATVLLGMNVASTINVDKTSGWQKTVITAPVSRKTYISSKYIMYVLLSFVGLIFGILFGMAVNLIFSQSTESAQLFICISISMALISGSVLMPFYFIFDENKSIMGAILAYPAAGGIFTALLLLLGYTIQTLILIVLISILLFAVSWYLSVRILSKKDI